MGTDELLAGFSYVNGRWTPAIYMQDALMSVTGISSHDGNPVWSADYTAFGDRTIGATGASTNRLQYTGRENDGTGLYYYRARYYDPSIGRFISEDPLGFKAGINFYAYVNNNPVNGNDPSGMVNWKQAGLSFIDVAGNTAGLFTGGFLTAAGAGLLLAPEPTGVTKIGGMATLSAGIANLGNSSIGLANSTRNFINALNDKPSDLPASGLTSLAGHFFPENQTAQNLATAGDLLLALASGRVPVGTVPVNSFSALAQNVPAGINEMLDAKAASVPSSMQGILLPAADSSYSAASRALDATQIGQLGSLAINQFLGSSPTSPAAGGFLLYPNKANTNQIQSVYAK